MEEKKKSKLPLVLNILLILSVGFLAFKISELTKKNHQFKQELFSLVKENEEMNQIIINQDIVSDADQTTLKELSLIHI